MFKTLIAICLNLFIISATSCNLTQYSIDSNKVFYKKYFEKTKSSRIKLMYIEKVCFNANHKIEEIQTIKKGKIVKIEEFKYKNGKLTYKEVRYTPFIQVSEFTRYNYLNDDLINKIVVSGNKLSEWCYITKGDTLYEYQYYLGELTQTKKIISHSDSLEIFVNQFVEKDTLKLKQIKFIYNDSIVIKTISHNTSLTIYRLIKNDSFVTEFYYDLHGGVNTKQFSHYNSNKQIQYYESLDGDYMDLLFYSETYIYRSKSVVEIIVEHKKLD